MRPCSARPASSPRKRPRQIIRGLQEILQEIVAGTFEFSIELEDIHMNIENRLIEKIGPVGGKLHTARSRNDQVALDIRMYLRDEIAEIHDLLAALQKVLVSLADQHRTWSCRATRICSGRSPCCSAIICLPTMRCSSATAAGLRTASAG